MIVESIIWSKKKNIRVTKSVETENHNIFITNGSNIFETFNPKYVILKN